MSLTDVLSRHVGPIQPGSLERVAHGEWSRAYLFTMADGRERVARFSATDEDFRKDQRAQSWASPELPIPRVLQTGRTDMGEFFAISERAHGEFIEERDAAAMQRLLPSLFETLDALRQVDLGDSRGFGLWRADGSAPHASWRAVLRDIANDPPSMRTHGWRERLLETPLAQRAFETGYARMLRLLDGCPDDARHLVHSDLLNFNVLVTGDRISAVLDWGAALFGDFLWDVAWFTFWQPWYTAWAAMDLRAAAKAHYRAIGLEVPNFEVRVRCYELAIGLDGLAYQAWAAKSADNLRWTARRVLALVDAVAGL